LRGVSKDGHNQIADTTSPPRGAKRPSFVVNSPPLKNRAQGMPDAQPAPMAPCTKEKVHELEVTTGKADHFGIPCAMV